MLEETERVTRSKVIKFTKWCGITTVNKMPHGNEKIIYVRFVPPFMKNGRSFKSWGEISIRGRGCNTPVLSIIQAFMNMRAQASSKHS